MADEQHAAEWRGNVLPAQTIASAREPRARRQLGSSQASNLASGARQQQAVREPVALDKRDLYAFPAPSARLLQQFFKLTPAETRLAQFMARAETIENAASGLGVKLCTARSQLAAIFEKTGTARQAELVALLSRLAHLSQAPAGRVAAAPKLAQN